MGEPGFLCVPSNCRQHVQSPLADMHPVIFMSKRRPEDGHDPVAHDLVERVGMLPICLAAQREDVGDLVHLHF